MRVSGVHLSLEIAFLLRSAGNTLKQEKSRVVIKRNPLQFVPALCVNYEVLIPFLRNTSQIPSLQITPLISSFHSVLNLTGSNNRLS